jgi:hypothetical protein
MAFVDGATQTVTTVGLQGSGFDCRGFASQAVPGVYRGTSMKQVAAMLLLCAGSTALHAADTITCHDLKGSSMHYGVSGFDVAKAQLAKKTEPARTASGPVPDGFENSMTFVIEGASVTVITNSSPADIQEREYRKKNNLAPLLPYPAGEAIVLMSNRDMISAVSLVQPLSITTYSFFPKFGSMFMTIQERDITGKDTSMMSVRGTCEFSLSR